MTVTGPSTAILRPADVCRALLAALEASEGRRRKRKRDQTPDAFGLGIKRDLLRRAVDDDPAPEAFEAWLLEYPLTCSAPELAGPALAMARAVFEEWRLAHSMGEFRRWLEEGAPSEDAGKERC
ncbi:MAG TPA: hypothetical protein VJ813_06790 [Vicinamibacterales bacterium]|nr:hypothetical protein [Vicinamibacterales bacterium]